MQSLVIVASLLSAVTVLLLSPAAVASPDLDMAYAHHYLGMSITVEQAVRMVEKRNLTDCVSRTICQLSCDPNMYGEDGQHVIQFFLKFQSNKSPLIHQFLKAECRGLSLAKKGKCHRCPELYPKCAKDGHQIIKLAKEVHITE